MNGKQMTTLERKQREREQREARDRVLAREVGIEIGRRREREKQHREREKAWGRGFFVGLIVATVCMFVGWYGAAKVEAAERPTVSTYADIRGKSAYVNTAGRSAASTFAAPYHPTNIQTVATIRPTKKPRPYALSFSRC